MFVPRVALVFLFCSNVKACFVAGGDTAMLPGKEAPMRAIGLCTLAVFTLLSAPLCAQVSSVVTDRVAAADDRNKMICTSEAETGSRLNRRRTCSTRAERDDHRRTERMHVERAQTNRIWPPG